MSKNIQTKKELLWQFIKFGIVGVLNTVIYLAIYYLFTWINPELYLVGSFVAWVISVLNAFYFGNRVVFTQENNSKKAMFKRLLKSYIAYGITQLLNMLFLWIEVDIFQISELIAPLINLLITIPLNFIINKFWTFKS